MEFRDMETDKTDLELIQEFQSGSSPAFDALYERYRRPLYGYVNRQMQGHTSQADDVFQQTWMRAIDNLSTYRDQEKFSAWLMRIAHNLIIDYYRSLKRRAEDELDETYGDTAEDTSGETPGRDMDERERARRLTEALNSLTPELREVFLLRRENIPFQQIAKIQNCSVNTSLARMRYAIKQLTNKLKDWESDNS